MNLLQLAIPVFFVLILIEIIVARIQGKRVYRLNDSLGDLSTLLYFSISTALITVAALLVYSWVEQNLALPVLLGWTLPEPNSPVSITGGFTVYWPQLAFWGLALLGTDFLYYWYHRFGHQVNFLWSSHITHHSSEEYNLIVALRQCSFQRIFEFSFALPLALLGVPWYMFLLCHGVVKIHQFWVHTRLIGKLGFLEYIIVTPSHHRVHHARDPQYIDKNHGGIFIWFDMLFGTYAPETDEPHYGLTKPLNSFNPFWSTVHGYVEMFRHMGDTPGVLNKFRIAYKPPGWRPEGRKPIPEVSPTYRKYDPESTPGVKAYALIQFLLTALVGVLLTRFWREGALETFYFLGGGLWVMVSLVGVNALLENRSWAKGLEVARGGASLLLGVVFVFNVLF